MAAKAVVVARQVLNMHTCLRLLRLDPGSTGTHSPKYSYQMFSHHNRHVERAPSACHVTRNLM